MQKETFIPTDWLPSDIRQVTEPTSKRPEDDIELITQRIESSRTDITSGYSNWRDLGFALVDAIGESGRAIYHRISRFNSGYTPEECDRQYDRCLNAHGTGITIRTFFQFAKDHGISLATTKCAKTTESTKMTEYAQCAYPQESSTEANNPQPAQTVNTAHSDNIVNIDEDLPLPAFSPQLRGKLPAFLEKVAANSNSPEDADILILGTMAVISACLPHIFGVYADRTVYPNIFLFVTAKASSGKGRLALCRYIVEPIHDRLREINEAEIIEYKHKLAEYNAAGKKKVDMEKPEEPPMRMLFIPAISYIRRKDREYVNIKSPRLSTLLTGTPRQILNLITDAENGLFSRFIFYFLDLRLVWNDVFSTHTDTTLDEHFQALGREFHDFHTILEKAQDIRFALTPVQAADFNERFSSWQSEYNDRCGDEFVASVRRLGLITFRLAMILSALRIMEDGIIEDRLICLDTDYQSAMTIASVILRHNAHIFLFLPKADTAQTTSSTTTARTTLQQRQFLEALPPEFDRQAYTELATALGINPRTADRIIHRWCDTGQLENVSHGKYRKK